MAMTLEQMRARNAVLEQQNQRLMGEHLEFKRKIRKLSWANYCKWFILLASVGVGGFSLWISIWSLVDSDRNGLAEAGVALSSVSLALSGVGLFSDCRCHSKRPKPESDQCPDNLVNAV